jgi:hypothetical protein
MLTSAGDSTVVQERVPTRSADITLTVMDRSPSSAGTTDGIKGDPLSQRPASLQALPELNALIQGCWQQRDLRRPTAAVLHAQLLKLLQAMP